MTSPAKFRLSFFFLFLSHLRILHNLILIRDESMTHTHIHTSAHTSHTSTQHLVNTGFHTHLISFFNASPNHGHRHPHGLHSLLHNLPRHLLPPRHHRHPTHLLHPPTSPLRTPTHLLPRPARLLIAHHPSLRRLFVHLPTNQTLPPTLPRRHHLTLHRRWRGSRSRLLAALDTLRSPQSPLANQPHRSRWRAVAQRSRDRPR